MLPKDVNDVTFAFPANVDEYLPKMEDIPQEYCSRNSKSKWVDLFNILFYGDERSGRMWITPKEGIDAKKAGRHIMCILKSYQPKHEHKLAGVIYLMDMWFEDWGISDN